jgi:hypothetical protein
MPTLEHEALVSMFRDNPPLAPQLVEMLFGVAIPTHTSVTVVEAGLDAMLPIEFRADLVLELRNELGQIVLSCILEVQRNIDRVKERSWPVYAAVEHSRKSCPTIVLVVAPDADVAAWASRPIDLGLGLHVMRPLVLGPRVVPVVTDPADAEKQPELAILSALAHADGPQALEVVMAALGVLGKFDQEHAGVYFHIVYNHIREPLQQAIMEFIMQRQAGKLPKVPPVPEKFMADFAKAYEAKFLREFEAKALSQIRESELKGLREGKRDTLLRLLTHAGIALTEDERARIHACTDVERLDQWAENVIGAKNAADVFK